MKKISYYVIQTGTFKGKQLCKVFEQLKFVFKTPKNIFKFLNFLNIGFVVAVLICYILGNILLDI